MWDTSVCILVIYVGAVWVPGSSGHPQPSQLTDLQADKDSTQSVLLQKLTETVSHPQHSSDSHLGVYTDKEVDGPSVFHRPKHTLFHASLQSRDLPQIKTSQSSSKFYNRLKLTGAEGDLAKSEALSQEVGDRERRKDKSMSKMVVTIVSTVTALVSMSLLVAIFQCCCRRKKRRTSEAKAPEDTVKTVVSNEDGRQSGKEVKPLNGEEDEPKEEPGLDSDATNEPVVLRRHDRESSEEKDVSVKNRIKAFQEKPSSPSSPDVRRQVVKKRPESDAFKVFENKGILIGMGRTKPKVTIEESDGEELDQERNDQSSPSTKTSPAVSPKPAKSPAVSPKPSKDRLYPDNPDVVIASEDEDDEFAVIKRESEVLKSFTKASAPKTRNRTSQAVGGRRARATNSPAPKPVSMIEEKTEEKGETSPLLNSKESDESKTREEKQKLLESVIDKSGVKSGPKELVTSNTTKNNPDSSPVSQSNIDTSGNIFLQIDPTAKRRSTGSSPVHSPVKEIPITERPKSTHEVIKGSPRPSPKPSPKPVRDDQLMKALSERLKKQSPDKEKADDL